MVQELSSLIYIDANGYHIPDYPTILSWLQGQYQLIYGSDVYLGSDSQDGQFLAVVAQALFDEASRSQGNYNSYSPATAQGVALSRQVKINGLTRNAGSFSTVNLTITGTAGTTIVNGIALDTINQQWLLPTPTVIPSGGSIVVTATAPAAGNVNAQSNTVTGIYTPTLGWQSVNNTTAASPGSAVEDDAELRARQAQSTALPSNTVLEGTEGAVANVTGVSMVRGYENDSGTTDGNGLPAHSFSICAVGGSATAIAQAIQQSKCPGTETYGNTSETVYDSHGMPLTIDFNVPVSAEISVQITLAALTGWTTDFEATIAAQVAAVVNAFGIGNNVLLSRIYPPAYLPSPQGLTYNISGIELQKNSGGFASADVSIGYNEYALCNPLTDFTFVVT